MTSQDGFSARHTLIFVHVFFLPSPVFSGEEAEDDLVSAAPDQDAEEDLDNLTTSTTLTHFIEQTQRLKDSRSFNIMLKKSIKSLNMSRIIQWISEVKNLEEQLVELRSMKWMVRGQQ